MKINGPKCDKENYFELSLFSFYVFIYYMAIEFLEA